MTTLLAMRDQVRNFVRDTGANVERRKVTDDEVDQYLQDALNDYSFEFSLQKVYDIASPSATESMPSDALPGECVYMVEVNSVLWTEWLVKEGESLPTSGNYWYWRGGDLAFAPTPTSQVSVWYKAAYPFPAADDATFTISSANEELLVLYASAKFHQKLGTVAAKLDRFRERGERDDNPLVMMHDVLMDRYHQLVVRRKPRGSVRVRRQ